MPTHLDADALAAALPQIGNSPADDGELVLVVRRPARGEREVLAEGTLDPANGLVGDNWASRGSRHTADGGADPDMQLNIMNSRVAQLVAVDEARMPLAGDQLYVDLDLGETNLPPGTRLAIGEAEVEVTAMPHLGCQKFVQRFGRDAMLFVNSDVGKSMKLRGINAKVTRGGVVRPGDRVTKVQ